MLIHCLESCSSNLEDRCVCLQGEGSLLATGSYDGQARIWSKDGMDMLTLEVFLPCSCSIFNAICQRDAT